MPCFLAVLKNSLNLDTKRLVKRKQPGLGGYLPTWTWMIIYHPASAIFGINFGD